MTGFSHSPGSCIHHCDIVIISWIHVDWQGNTQAWQTEKRRYLLFEQLNSFRYSIALRWPFTRRVGRDVKCGTTGSEIFNPRHVIRSLNGFGNFKLMSHTSICPEALPFFQRKPVFSIIFLLIRIPYHSEYLNGVANFVDREDLDHKELWESNDLKIPVCNTENSNYFFLHLGAYMLIYILIGPNMHELSCLLHALFVIKSSLCSLDQSHKLSRDCHSCYWLWPRSFEWY